MRTSGILSGIMSVPSLEDLRSVAIEAAYLGGRRSLAYFNAGIEVELKSDQTPVTVADREAEQVIRRRIRQVYPTHSLFGEEWGEDKGDPDYKWIIDPIDGTKTFIRGVPFYGTLIGVEVKGQPAIGVAYMPALDEMVSAATGLGCLWNGRPARVSTVADMGKAAVMCTDVRSARKRSGAFDVLAERTLIQRTWGDCYGYVLVATGRAEVMVDPAMSPWDCAPFLPILREAGGHFCTWQGEPTIWGKDAIATNDALYESVLEIMRT
jgi:histidinol-phosphatase